MRLFESIRRFFSSTHEESGLPDEPKNEPEHSQPAKEAVPLRYKCWRCETVYRRLKAKRRKFKCQCGIELFPLTGEWTKCAECNLEFPYETLGSCPRCDFRAEEARQEAIKNPPPPKPPGLTNEELWRKWQ